MAKAMLLGPVEMAEVEARLANMGKELYQLVEDYPALPGWNYAEFLMFMYQQIFYEAVKLKKAASTAKEALRGNPEKVASTQVS